MRRVPLALLALGLSLALLLAPSRASPALGYYPTFNARMHSLVVTPTVPARLYALVEQTGPWTEETHELRFRVFTSEDGGRNWAPYTMRGLEGAVRLHSLTLDYRARPDTLYVIGDAQEPPLGRLYRSQAGSDWSEVGGTAQPLTAVAVDFLDGNVLYGGVQQLIQVGEFVRSTDGGRTWSHFDAELPAPGQPAYRSMGPVQQILIDPTDPDTIYALAAYTYRTYGPSLWRGDRQGRWVSLPLPPVPGGGQGAFGLAFDPATGALYTGSWSWGGGAARPEPEARGLWRTSNPRDRDPARVSWTQVQHWDYGNWGWFAAVPSVLPLAVDAGPDRALYVQTHGADAALWKSPDGGQTWQPLPIPRLQGEWVPGGGGDAWTAPTGHVVGGEWLRFLKAHGDVENLGYPRTPVIADPVAGGQVVQYFQRAVLEWHPEAPAEYRIQRRLLGDALDPGADPPLSEEEIEARRVSGAVCFPEGPGLGLGHCVSDRAPDGTPIYFLEHFESRGGVDAFGFPKEEPRQRDGRWTQRFQAAVFEHHPEHDIEGFVPGTDVPWRNFRVELALLGDRFIELWKLPYR